VDRHALAPYGSAFIDLVLEAMKLKSDAALATAFGTTAPVISKVRNGRAPISDALIVCAHEATGLSIHELKSFLPQFDRRSANYCSDGLAYEAPAGGRLLEVITFGIEK
jgi:hypothetical protein